MISLVMCTYNGEKYIKKQLDSIRNQTLQPNEVIIMDDYSSDNTVSIISDYIKNHNLKNWRLLINKRNLGYKENFYNGVLEAQGDYIFLCDQDDIWKTQKIEIMIGIYKKHPEIWCLNCGVELIDEEDNPINITCEHGWQNANFLYDPQKLTELNFYDLPYITRHNITPGCAMVIDKRTRNVFLKTYNKILPHDWHMNMVAAASNGCCYFNNNLVFYRIHDSNAIGANTGITKGIMNKTRAVRIKDYKARIDACKKICEYYKIEEPDISLLRDMVSFYEGPNPIKLLKLRNNKLYKELAKNKVRLWEIVTSFRIDEIIKRMVGNRK